MHPSLRDWMNQPQLRSTVEDKKNDYGIQYMDYENLVSSIVDDLLSVHFLSNGKAMIHERVLVRFVSSRLHKTRVYAALQDPRILELTIQDPRTRSWQLTPQREKLIKAIKISGTCHNDKLPIK